MLLYLEVKSGKHVDKLFIIEKRGMAVFFWVWCVSVHRASHPTHCRRRLTVNNILFVFICRVYLVDRDTIGGT